VDIEVLGGNVSVKYNDVEFFDRSSAATTGYAMLGYEDPFATSAAYTPGSNPNFPGPFPVADWMWGIFDNFTVEVIPEPASATLCTIGVFLLIARRRR
jgi:hypothetical protein